MALIRKKSEGRAGRHIDPGSVERVSRTPEEIEVHPDGMRLGEMLITHEVIGREDLIDALMKQDSTGERLGDLLVGSGALSRDDLTLMLAQQSGVGVVDVRDLEFDPKAVDLVPEDLARSLPGIPVSTDNGVIKIVVSEPSADVRERLEGEIGKKVELLAASRSDILMLLDTAYHALAGVPEVVERFESADAIRRAVDELPVEVSAEDAPVIQVVRMILTQALRDRASDIHFEPTEDGVRLRYRIDGTLHEMLTLPHSMSNPLVSRVKILAGLNIVERRRPQDGQISLQIDDSDLDIRVAIAPTIFGEKVVLRLLDKSNPLFMHHELGMADATEKRFIELIQSPYGMVVCSGPTGSGKTTTLYATLQVLNSEELNITTIEDPVEYVLPTINQIQINPSADVTFVSGLRSILRQDPDVILVGEIRDTETARIAVRSALTGHLVLSSIHATDSASAVQRFVDMGIEPFLLTSSVIGVVAQRLVRKVCTHCREEYRPGQDELAFHLEAGGTTDTVFVRGQGCSFCARTGYLGRTGVFELLVLDDAIREAIASGATRDQIRSLAVANGMSTLRDEGIRLVDEGATTISEIVRHIWTI